MRILFSVLMIFMMVSTAQAQDFWKGLKGKVDTATPKKSTATTAVGGIRGAQEESADTLYWKGKEEPFVVAEEELKAFNSALDMAMQGVSREALEAFSKFLADYPKSVLAGDAKEALAQLEMALEQQEPAVEEEQKPAEGDEQPDAADIEEAELQADEGQSSEPAAVEPLHEGEQPAK